MTTDVYERVQPAFRAAVAAAGRVLGHEGAIAAEEGETLYEAEEAGARLSLTLKHGKIARAVHAGAAHLGDIGPPQRAVLDVVCDLIRGLPLQEAADHAGHHLVARLRNGVAAPVAGIVSPWNADPLFHLPMRLLRRINADHRARQGIESLDNKWNPTLSKDWVRLDEAAQVARLASILSGFLVENELAEGDMEVMRVERNLRVFVAFAEGFDYDRKPRLLLKLERRLRAATGDRLEVFAEDKKDANRIRRL